MKIVISLGGSLIVPDKVDYNLLKNFRRVIFKFKKDKIVVVCGGGRTARTYIDALGDKSEKIRSLIGINATRLNAMLVSNFLDNQIEIPESMDEVKKILKRKNLVVCGALGYREKMTSDGTAADVARSLKADMMINMTNVKGLYDKDPRKFKDAKFIPKISFEDFLKKANKIKFKPGQHFVLDKVASEIITKHKIKTYIISGTENLEKVIKGKEFVGTIIC